MVSGIIKLLSHAYLFSIREGAFIFTSYPAGASSPHRAGDNPISGAQRMGGDFVRNFATPELDFACVHIWADLWLYCDEECKLAFLQSWIVGRGSSSISHHSHARV